MIKWDLRKGYATGEDFKFTRMCGPKNVFNRVRCLGIRKEESKVEIHRPGKITN